MPNIKVTYFDAAGRAEPVRIALFLASLPFDDERLDFNGFMERKQSGSLPLGSVPTMTVDGFVFAETAAMMRYAANASKTPLYPSEPTRALIVDSALEAFNDTLSHALLPSLFERDLSKKLEMRKEFVAGPMRRVFRYVESMLERFGGPFLGGSMLTVADILVACQIMQIRSGGLDGISTEHLAEYPRINALCDAWLADERVKAYHEHKAGRAS